MTQALKDLRDKIDSIDGQLLDLLRTRANVIEEVRRVKGKQTVYIRPGREATMLRALIKQPMGHLPQGLAHRLWREILGAFTLQEGAMKVALPLMEGEQGFWDIARDHFGSFTPMQGFSTPTAALRAVLNGGVQLAALPLPQEGEPDNWWRFLLAEQACVPNVFYVFPFDGMRGNARKTNHQGVVIGAISPEATGQDRTVLVAEWQNGVDRKAAQAWIQSLPLISTSHVFTPAGDEPACSWIEIEGFIEKADPDLAAWATDHKHGLLCHKVIGAYPVPISSSS